MATVLITGGTGMIGKALTKALLEKDHTVIILTRDPEKQTVSTSKLGYAKWNIEQQTIDEAAIIKADHIIHLTGAGVADKRWTKKRKQEIVNSRVDSGKLITETLKTILNNVKSVISISGIGWYGADPVIPNPDPFEEDDSVDGSFLGETCKKWEASIEPIIQLGKRLVIFRTGIVLSNEGGALVEFEKPLRFGIAAILGSGKQMISWIHIGDLVRLFITAIENEKMEGIYNAVAPRPVSNKDLTLQLAKIKRGRFFVPVHVPGFVLKLIVGEVSIEVLKSATVSCNKIHFESFSFQFPSIEAALKDLV
jgi:uncharacterized protein (TIGR01777 family)